MTFPATIAAVTVTPITLSCACSSNSSSIRLSCASSIKTLTNQTSNRTSNRSNISSVKSAPSDSTAIVDNPTAESTTTSEEDEIQAKVGARVRVTVPLKVYHVPKVPELDLNGKEGKLKEYVAVWRGKHISANLPYKIEFFEKLEGRGDAPVKFFAHLKDDEFEFLD